MIPGDSNDFLAFVFEFNWYLLLVICSVRWLLCLLLVLLDGLESQSWFHWNQSWSPWSQLWFVSPQDKHIIITLVVVKQIKVGFMEINFGFNETNFDFPSRTRSKQSNHRNEQITRRRSQMNSKTNARKSLESLGIIIMVLVHFLY